MCIASVADATSKAYELAVVLNRQGQYRNDAAASWLQQNDPRFATNTGRLPELHVADGPGDVVYLVQEEDDGAVKIGRSTWEAFPSRLADLQSANPRLLRLRQLIRGGAGLERTLHGYFEPLLIRGEWFRCEGELAAMCNELPKPQEKEHRKLRLASPPKRLLNTTETVADVAHAMGLL